MVTAGILATALSLALADRPGIDAQERPPAFYYLFARNEPTAALVALAALAIAFSPVGRRLGTLALGWILALGRHPARGAAIIGAALALSATLAYQRYPLSLDEWMPILQAQIFAEGQINGRIPPELFERLIPKNFVNWFYRVDPFTGAFASAYWPGHALLLTPFVVAGLPWLLNPLLGAAALVLATRACRLLTRRRATIGWCIALFVASASFVVNASSFYSMTGHLVLNLAYVLLLVRPQPARLVLAGMLGSLSIVLHQPIFHPLVALPWLLRLILERRWRGLLWLALGYLPLILLVGLPWHALRLERAAVLQQYRALLGEAEARATAAAADRASQPLTSFLRTITGTFSWPTGAAWRAETRSHLELWTWCVPGLPLLAGLGAWFARRNRDLACIAASFATTLGAFFLIPLDQGHGWGYRYLEAAWWCLPVLAAYGLTHGRHLKPIARPVAATVLAAAIALVPLRLWQVHGFIELSRRQLPPVDAQGPTILFLDTSVGFYREDLVRNDPFLRDELVIMVASDPTSDALVAAALLENPRRIARVGKDSIWSGERWRGPLEADLLGHP